MLRLLASLILGLAAFGLVPASASALSDGGAPSAACSDSDEWLRCSTHADCPDGLVCLSGGVCACDCPIGGSVCDDTGCQCCPEIYGMDEGCFLETGADGCPELVCPDEGGCSASAPASVPWALAGFLVSWVVIRRRPRGGAG